MNTVKIFKNSISKQELSDMPLRRFSGKITVVDTPEQLKPAVNYLATQKTIGFDTETKPAFKKGVFNEVALLQLSTQSHAFLFRLNRIGLPQSLRKILANPSIAKPGVAIHDDIKALQHLKNFQPAGFVELQDHAKEMGITDFSLKKLAAITCGFRISKGQQLSNWEADTLTEAQQIYAATDAWAALGIYENMTNHVA